MNNMSMFINGPEICFTVNQWRMGTVESGLGVDGTRFAPNFCVCFKISIVKSKKKKMGGGRN